MVPELDGEKRLVLLGVCREGRRVRRAFSLQDPSTCPTNPTGRSWSPRRPGEKGPNGLVSACRYWVAIYPEQGCM